MLNVIYSGRFKKDYKKCIKRGLNMNLLKSAIATLAIPVALSIKNQDHDLKGDIMDITNVVDKLRNDYHNTQNIINKSIKYSFDYHYSHTDIYYLEENGLQNQILLSICVKDKYYLTTISFSNNDYQINPYIPNEIYQHIKDDIFSQDGYSPVPYFNKLCSVILNKVPIITDYKNDTKNYNFHVYKDYYECPFLKLLFEKTYQII